MPLKHLTETVLVALLALALIVMGIAVSFLPPLPGGFTPWIVVFVLSMAYPLGLYSFLRSNRADNWFRALHFFPAAIAALWLAFELVALRLPSAMVVERWFLWGYCAVPVMLSLILLADFCLHVIRRQVPRLSVISLLAILFLAGAFAHAAYPHWERQLAASILPAWRGSGSLASRGQGSAAPSVLADLPHSGVPEEEAWREKLRALASSKGRVSSSSARAVAAVRSSGASSAAIASAGVQSSTPPLLAGKPKRLPSAGVGFEGFAAFFLAAYCAVLHARARRRALA